MRTLIISIFVFTISQVKLFGTYQMPDKLIWVEDTLDIYMSSPLEDIDSFSIKLHDAQYKQFDEIFESTACYRGFIAKWEISNDSLFLVGIKDFNIDRDLKKITEKIIGREFKNGKVYADWVNGSLWSGTGIIFNRIYYNIYEKEIEFIIANGRVRGINKYEMQICPYHSFDSLQRFIEERIHWESLDITNKKSTFEVFMEYVKPNTFNVHIHENANQGFINELKTILSYYPCLDYCYLFGQIEAVWNSFQIGVYPKERRVIVHYNGL